MKIGEPDPGVGQPVEVGGVDLSAERANVGEPEIVCHYHQEIGPCHGEASCQVFRPMGTLRLQLIQRRPMRLTRLGGMIGVSRLEDVLTIELQRPERRNALNSQLVEELREAIEKAAGEDVHAVVLTGEGTVFCAGADLSGDAFAADYPDRLIALHKAIDATPVPVIAAINGPAIGAGLQLAMICDLRVVAPDAFFQFPTSKYGLALDNWSIRRLSSLVGHGRARAMLLTAEKLTAEAALTTGMANRIGTVADAQAWAAEIAGLAPLALRHAKRVLNDDGAYEDQWPVHKELFDKAWASQDVVEAQVARVEKRPPKFRGA
jgi:enoyl-CoA hydratase